MLNIIKCSIENFNRKALDVWVKKSRTVFYNTGNEA